MSETMYERYVREAAERNAAITAELLASLEANPDALPVLVRAFVDLVDEADSLDDQVALRLWLRPVVRPAVGPDTPKRLGKPCFHQKSCANA